jgi:O-acetyl-ADP-ribose deacetylase (regulator of RNase III)
MSHENSPMQYEKLIDEIYSYLITKFKCDDTNVKTKRDFICYVMTTSQDVILPDEINKKLNYVLQSENANNLIDFTNVGEQVTLYKGDITKLITDCIVNAANSDGLGCFSYGHKCVDNIIHNKAGPQLRNECKNILGKNHISTGNAIVTRGYNLPSKYVIHVVGPIYSASNDDVCDEQLKQSYIACLNICKVNRIKQIAFCCVSTGIFGFPNDDACDIAVDTVKNWLNENNNCTKVIFCTFLDIDYQLYKKKLGI